MKRMVITMALAMAGGLALAQTAATVPAPTTSATPAVTPGTVASPAAPAAGIPPERAKQQEIMMELRKVQQELRTYETGLDQDPDIKAMDDKIKETMTQYQDLQKQRGEKVDAKLSTDPKAAVLVEKRKELRAKMMEMMKAAYPNGMPGMPGGGPGMMPPRPMQPMRGPDGAIVTPPAPKPAPNPAPAPAADKPADPAK